MTNVKEFWDNIFAEKQLTWGTEPAKSAIFAKDCFVREGAKTVLIPGVGYGRNAKAFVDAGMSVTGIEIAEEAITLARTYLDADIQIYHGSATEMPYDDERYDGIFCFGLIHLFDTPEREKLIRDCYNQLNDGGHMIFTILSTAASTYGEGNRLGDNRYEVRSGVKLYFHDKASIDREFGPYGLVETSSIDDPSLITVVCTKG